MKHTIIIERRKRETCEISIDAENYADAQEQSLSLYLAGHLENDFEIKIKQENLSMFNETEDSLKTVRLNTY